MIGVIRLGKSAILTLINSNKLYLTINLPKDNIIQTSWKYLSNCEIKELHVIITPTVRIKDVEVNGELMGELTSETNSYINHNDMAKLKILGEKLKVEQLKIFSIFEVLKLLTKEYKDELLIVGNYINNLTYYLHLDTNKVLGFRESITFDKQVINQIVNVEVTTVVTEENSILSNFIKDKFINIPSNLDILDSIYPTLVTRDIKPSIVVDYTTDEGAEEPEFTDREFTEIREYSKLEESGEEEYEDESDEEEEYEDESDEENYEDESDEEDYEDKEATTNDDDTENNATVAEKIASGGLSVVACGLSVLIGFSLFSNKQLTEETANIKDKIVQLEESIIPVEHNKNYLTEYSKLIQSGGPKDYSLIEKISAIEIDGILSEVVVQQDIVGMIVYFANEKDVDGFVTKLNEIIDTSDVTKGGTLGLDNISLTQFKIHGKLKNAGTSAENLNQTQS